MLRLPTRLISLQRRTHIGTHVTLAKKPVSACHPVLLSHSLKTSFRHGHHTKYFHSTSRACAPLGSSGDEHKKKNEKIGAIPKRMNDSFDHFPFESLGCLLAAEISMIYGTHMFLLSTGVSVPVEFGVAFALSRPFRRLRLPIEIVGAALLTKAMPMLTQIKISKLSSTIPPATRAWAAAKAGPKAQAVKDVIDKYGAAYFISARWTGVLVVSSIFVGLEVGVDVQSYLASYGFDELGSILSEWAAAVAISSLFYPFSIVLGGYGAPVVAKARHAIVKAMNK